MIVHTNSNSFMEDINIFENINEKNYIQCYWQKYKPNQYINQIEKHFKVFVDKRDAFEHLIIDSNHWFIIASVFSSNNIENAGLPINETKQLISNFITQDPYDVSNLVNAINNETNTKRKEVLQHLHAYHYLCEMELHSTLTQEIILNTHALLMKDMKREDDQDAQPGEYRVTRVTVGRNEDFCTKPEEIQKQMNDLFKWLNDSIDIGRIDPFHLAADLKYRLIKIHPFVDGNGRVSRLLMNWVLLKFGLPFPIALQAGFSYRSKKNYFGCYKACHPEKALASLVVESIHLQFCSFFERIRYTQNENLSIDDMLLVQPFQELCEWKDHNGYTIDEMLRFIMEIQGAENCLTRSEKIEKIRLQKAVLFAMQTKSNIPRHQVANVQKRIENVILGNESPSSKPFEFSINSYRSYEDMESIAKAYRYICIEHVMEELSVELVLQVYNILYPDQSLRENEDYIGFHLFPPSYCIPSCLKMIVDQYNTKKGETFAGKCEKDNILLASWLMYQILALHPFKYGNGRLSRLLLNWSLLSCGGQFPVSFGAEEGACKGHKTLLVCIQMARANLSKPSMLATRVLVSLYNSWKAIQ